MKSITYSLIILLLTISLAACSSLAFKDEPGTPHPGHPGHEVH